MFSDNLTSNMGQTVCPVCAYICKSSYQSWCCTECWFLAKHSQTLYSQNYFQGLCRISKFRSSGCRRPLRLNSGGRPPGGGRLPLPLLARGAPCLPNLPSAVLSLPYPKVIISSKRMKGRDEPRMWWWNGVRNEMGYRDDSASKNGQIWCIDINI